MTGEHTDRNGDPHFVETERLLAGLHFSPRASLGPEIAGRAGRGESAPGAASAVALGVRSVRCWAWPRRCC